MGTQFICRYRIDCGEDEEKLFSRDCTGWGLDYDCSREGLG